LLLIVICFLTGGWRVLDFMDKEAAHLFSVTFQ
jgi:hypothetical protein